MADPAPTAFLPTLSPLDIDRAVQLIQQASSPVHQAALSLTPDDLRRIQHDLFEIQKRPEAWGLVIPLLDHPDPTVQFFGAHTAQVKIARDWDTFPQEHAESLRDLMVQLTAHSMAIHRSKFILRKLFVSLTSLALRLVPGIQSRWPNWLMSCVGTFSSRGCSKVDIHDFLAIVAEEVYTADLVGQSKSQVRQSLRDSTAMVAEAIRSSTDLSQPLQQGELPAALKCLQAWLNFLELNLITPIIPTLIALLDPSNPDPTPFISASDTLQEIMSKALSDGAGTKTITEPLLIWMDVVGSRITAEVVRVLEANLGSEEGVGEIGKSLCKLIAALGDHSAMYLAANLASRAVISLPPAFTGGGALAAAAASGKTRAELVQGFLKSMMMFSGLPGYYGVDEDESEFTLGFWYLFQEALWATDFYMEADGAFGDAPPAPDGSDSRAGTEHEAIGVSKIVYEELVKVLRRKVTFPGAGANWSKDQVDKFLVYRRDVGDTLINAYYVLRDNMLLYYVNDVVERLAARTSADQGWQDIEATLHCIMSIQEALDMEKSPYLARVFEDDVLGRLPKTGHPRIRRTMLSLIGAYSSWFALQTTSASSSSTTLSVPSSTRAEASRSSTPIPPTNPLNPADPSSQGQVLLSQQDTTRLLMAAVGYVVAALPDSSLCLQAASALRNLCDANRKTLAPQIAAFADLHASLSSVPDSEKSKVLQSIASVIQALPPEEEIPPVLAIVNPIVQKLAEALQSASTLPDEARATAILQLEILSGVAKGLTRTSDFISLDDDGPEAKEELRAVDRARNDPRTVKLREDIYAVIRNVMELWSVDAEIGLALSDLFKSVTSLPSDLTLISLGGGPMIELVCFAVQRQVTATWLSLFAILTAQLNPPPAFEAPARRGPPPESEAIMRSALPLLLQCALSVLAQPGAMEANPDIVQEFFSCLDRVAQDFTATFYALPDGALDTLIRCAVTSLGLQERYSLVAACTFLTTFVHRSTIHDRLIPARDQILAVHGPLIVKALLWGFAAVAPRTTSANLADMLGALATRCDAGVVAGWVNGVLFADDFVESKATRQTKEAFAKALAGTKSLKKIKEAANQFMLVSRGLEGTSFGYSSVTM